MQHTCGAYWGRVFLCVFLLPNDKPLNMGGRKKKEKGLMVQSLGDSFRMSNAELELCTAGYAVFLLAVNTFCCLNSDLITWHDFERWNHAVVSFQNKT